MLKKLRNQKGFTLVEVIVVAVIVLILAAVAIPLYNGYIADSRKNVAENTAGSLASALAANIQQDAEFPTITGGLGETITIKGVSTTDNIFKVPTDYKIIHDATAGTVKAQFKERTETLSNPYVYKVGAGS